LIKWVALFFLRGGLNFYYSILFQIDKKFNRLGERYLSGDVYLFLGLAYLMHKTMPLSVSKAISIGKYKERNYVA
jgi:hypothetical protein